MFSIWSPSSENFLNFGKISNGTEIPGQKFIKNWVHSVRLSFSSGISRKH